MPTEREIEGRIDVHPRGFGFVTPSPEHREAVPSAFVTPPDLNRFLAGDRVRARAVQGEDGRWTATSLTLLERWRTRVFGEVVVRRGRFLRIDREIANTDWPLQGEALPAGTPVVAIVGEGALTFEREVSAADAPLVRILVRHGVDPEVSPEVLALAEELKARPHALGGRRDLRSLPTVTVDAPVTRDIDDAISVLPAGPDGAIRLFVSIADVSAFVEEDSPIDLAARARGTSVYLAGKVVPMLPESLSAGHLSLLEGVDRLCLTAELRIDPEGRVTAADVYESVIRSFARLNYTEFAAYLEKGEISPPMERVRDSLPWFRAADARLAVARNARGGLRFHREEAHFTFDDAGAVTGIEASHDTPAHGMIERFMVAANEAIAEFLVARGVPSLFRVHDLPDPERIAELSLFSLYSGYAAGFGRELTPIALAAFDRQIAGTPAEPALRSVLRRALGPSRYQPTPAPHFGLAARHYLHFTSPIRRYSDLSVHRTVKRYLRGERDFAPSFTPLGQLAGHLNEKARHADRAERDRHRMLEATLLASRIGETFRARVTRVKPFGLLVQLDGMQVEGVVPTDALGKGPARANASETELTVGERSWSIGLPLEVRVESADAAAGRIEFTLAR
jgi:ribonuclease R